MSSRSHAQPKKDSTTSEEKTPAARVESNADKVRDIKPVESLAPGHTVTPKQMSGYLAAANDEWANAGKGRQYHSDNSGIGIKKTERTKGEGAGVGNGIAMISGGDLHGALSEERSTVGPDGTVTSRTDSVGGKLDLDDLSKSSVTFQRKKRTGAGPTKSGSLTISGEEVGFQGGAQSNKGAKLGATGGMSFSSDSIGANIGGMSKYGGISANGKWVNGREVTNHADGQSSFGYLDSLQGGVGVTIPVRYVNIEGEVHAATATQVSAFTNAKTPDSKTLSSVLADARRLQPANRALAGLDPKSIDMATLSKKHPELHAAYMSERFTPKLKNEDNQRAKGFHELDVDQLQVGEGFTVETQDTRGGSAGANVLGVIGGSGGVDSGEGEQVTVTRNAKGFELEMRESQTSSAHGGADLGSGALAFKATGSDTSAKSVKLQIDGPDAAERIKKIQQQGLLPGVRSLHDPKAMAAYDAALRSGDMEKARGLAGGLNQRLHRLGPDKLAKLNAATPGADYTTSRGFEEVDRSDWSVFGLKFMDSHRRQWQRTETYSEQGEGKRNYLAGEDQDWLFDPDTHQTHISSNPRALDGDGDPIEIAMHTKQDLENKSDRKFLADFARTPKERRQLQRYARGSDDNLEMAVGITGSTMKTLSELAPDLAAAQGGENFDHDAAILSLHGLDGGRGRDSGAPVDDYLRLKRQINTVRCTGEWPREIERRKYFNRREERLVAMAQGRPDPYRSPLAKFGEGTDSELLSRIMTGDKKDEKPGSDQKPGSDKNALVEYLKGLEKGSAGNEDLAKYMTDRLNAGSTQEPSAPGDNPVAKKVFQQFNCRSTAEFDALPDASKKEFMSRYLSSQRGADNEWDAALMLMRVDDEDFVAENMRGMFADYERRNDGAHAVVDFSRHVMQRAKAAGLDPAEMDKLRSAWHIKAGQD